MLRPAYWAQLRLRLMSLQAYSLRGKEQAMPENLEITKKLRERFKNCELLEYVGDWKGRPVYRVSEQE